MKFLFQIFKGRQIGESLKRRAPGTPRLIILFACAILLPAWGTGEPGSFLAEEHGIKRGVDLLREKFGPKARIFSVEISQDRITVLIQDPLNRRSIVAWRLQRNFFHGINWEGVEGPEEASPSLVNPDIEANLFDLAEVDLEAAEKLKQAAIARADLEDPAQISEIVIRRRIFILPSSSGAVEWHVHVASRWEFADIYANADGSIRSAELQHTHKAQQFDLLKRPELVLDAAKAFRTQLGAGQVLMKVSIDKRGASFGTNLPDQRPGIIGRFAGKGFATDAAYHWSPYNLCGGCVEQSMGHISYISKLMPEEAPFSIDDTDLTIVPKLMAAAKEKLGMPEGQITEIELSKPIDPVSGPKFSWKAEVKDKNGETGSIRTDFSGSVQQVRLPASRASPADWSSSDKVMEGLSRVAKEYGSNWKLRSITFHEHVVDFTCDDPKHPGELAAMELTDDGFAASISPPFPIQQPPFTIADLHKLTPEKLSALRAQTLTIIKHPDWPITDVSVERSQWSRKGVIVVTISAYHPRTHDGARVAYDLDGTVVDVWN